MRTWIRTSCSGSAARGSGRGSGRAAVRTGRGAAGLGRRRRGKAFRPSRDLGAKRDAYAAGAPSGSLGRMGGGLGSEPGAGGIPAWDDEADPSEAVGGLRRGLGPRERGVIPPRPIVPGERRYRDGDRVRHARWGDGAP